METRRLRLLLELARLGSMRAVAEEMHLTTSTVSQQLAVLAREAGTALVEPDGRRVRLTPAGRRLADHAAAILAAVDAARRDLDPDAEPAGTVRVAGFATAIRRSLVPLTSELAARHPAVSVQIHEHEPGEALGLLAEDRIDLALTYDYDLAPAAPDGAGPAVRLWSVPWGLAVPAGERAGGGALEVVGRFHGRDWIVNSRSSADETVVRTLASMAGFTPAVTHRADDLDLVQDLVLAGLGVGLLPANHPLLPGVALLPLREPGVVLRAYARTRRGRADWAPLRLVLRLLRRQAEPAGGP
ncbi:MAG: LysR family transcriptional regulator [Pseudonocardia sp.]